MNEQDIQIQERLLNLPQNIQDAINNFDWAGEVLAIGRDHEIQVDDIELFRRETMRVIVGLSPASSYRENLAKRMAISDELAQELVFEANTKIFEELQRRAFGRDSTETEEVIDFDEKKEVGGKNVATYLEPIDDDDLRGISGRTIEFRDTLTKQKSTMDFEKNIITTTLISKGDRINASPNEQEQVKEDGKFLEHLKES